MPDDRTMPEDRKRVDRRFRGFAPVIDAGVRVLVLGSFPSSASLAARQYYGHPRNQFWPILGEILGEPLAQLAYAQRLERVLAHRIGIWDVYAACRRSGSLDSQIHAPQSNDLASLPRLAPQLRAVAFNGQAAARFRAQVAELGVAYAVLPSTSPAHAARRLEQKLSLWRAFFQAWC
jgi:hypoxanthine-DNA glycosylase